MLVSALFTSVGINSCLCIIFFMLYYVLRKQPSNYDVYIPRLVSEGKQELCRHFRMTRCLPSPSWVNKAWELTEDELLLLSGLDAVVFIRMLIFSLKVFSVTGAIGIFVLLPVNCLGTQLEHFDFYNLSNNSLDLFSISNVNFYNLSNNSLDSSIEGYISHGEIINSACDKVIWFTIWNVFFATVFSGSALYQISIILDPTNIPSRLAVAVPAQASFFIAYVVTSGWTGTATDLLRVIPLIISLARRSLLGTSADETSEEQPEVPTIPYHKEFPQVLFFGLLGITYFFLAPLILPFLLIYFCLAYIIFHNQFINVYSHAYETGGKFWPVVHNTMIFSLLLMHAIAVGTFTLKKLSGASSLLFPLPVFTLIFNEYCRKRFLPTFQAYSAETLIKKDREDQNDPRMSEFLNKLKTAYHDPTLMPMPFPTDPRKSHQSSPFLGTMRM